MTHSVFTVIAPLSPAGTATIRARLETIAGDPAKNALLPLGELDHLHFASFSIHEDPRGPKLIFESNIDGPAEPYLVAALALADGGLSEVLGCCSGWPADRDAQLRWLLDHLHEAGAYHVGDTGRSLARIRQEASLREAIESFLDAERAKGTLPSGEAGVRKAIQAFVASDPGLAWARSAPARETTGERAMAWTRLVGTGAVAVVAALALLPLTLLGVVALRIKERTDRQAPDKADRARVARLVELEDWPPAVHNHMTSVVPVKSGWLRNGLLRLVLLAIDLLARTVFTKGELGGISSIHFAHWSVIDGGRNLLFVSNYDGSWESYLDDFIEKAHIGLTAVWSNSEGFPRAEWLVRKGATDGRRFKHWARMTMIDDLVWYSAYPELSVHGINDNSTIREELFAPLSSTKVTAWLQLL
jgi:hypothetical protein